MKQQAWTCWMMLGGLCAVAACSSSSRSTVRDPPDGSAGATGVGGAAGSPQDGSRGGAADSAAGTGGSGGTASPLPDAGDSGAADALDGAPTCANVSCTADAGSCYMGICGGARIVQIAAGDEFACARLAAGEVHCWGKNGHGQLGDKRSDPSFCPNAPRACGAPAKIAALGTDVIDIAAGSGFACARKSDQSVVCWGSNVHGELGHVPGAMGDTNCQNGDACQPRPVAISLPGGERAAELSVGTGYGCARTTTKHVYCWGTNSQGQLGNGGIDTGPVPVAAVTSLSDVMTFAAGFIIPHTCAVLGTSRAVCWGDNYLDTLAIGDGGAPVSCGQGRVCQTTPTLIPSDSTGAVFDNLTGIFPYYDGTCALKVDHTVYCWGVRGPGPLGNPGQSIVLRPTRVTIDPVRKLVAGYQHACAISVQDGKVSCWGRADLGQLGNGQLITATTSDCGSQYGCATTPRPTALSNVQVLSIGADFTLALRENGTAWGWGKNNYGQTGHVPGTVQGDVPKCSVPFNDAQSAPCTPTPIAVSGLPTP